MQCEPDAVLPVEPDVPSWAETAWRCWMELSPDRPYTVSGFAAPMGGTMIQSRPGPLPWALLHEWCDRCGCGTEMRDFVLGAVRTVDREFLAHWHASQATGASAGNSLADKAARWDQEMAAEEGEQRRIEGRQS